MLFWMLVKGNPDRKKKNTTQKTFKPSEKKISIPRMDKKKLHTWEFQLKHSSRNMRRKLLQKRFIGKRTECSKHLRDIAIEKNILSEQMHFSNTYKLFQKYSFILVLYSFNFYFKIMWPLPPHPPPVPSWRGGGRVHALKAQLKLSPLIQNRVQ